MILKDFNETFAYKLRDREYLVAYLEGCLDEGLPTFYIGLRNAVQARDGAFTWLSNETGLARAGLYRALSANGNPSFKTVFKVLAALGVDNSVLTREIARPAATMGELAHAS